MDHYSRLYCVNERAIYCIPNSKRGMAVRSNHQKCKWKLFQYCATVFALTMNISIPLPPIQFDGKEGEKAATKTEKPIIVCELTNIVTFISPTIKCIMGFCVLVCAIKRQPQISLLARVHSSGMAPKTDTCTAYTIHMNNQCTHTHTHIHLPQPSTSREPKKYEIYNSACWRSKLKLLAPRLHPSHPDPSRAASSVRIFFLSQAACYSLLADWLPLHNAGRKSRKCYVKCLQYQLATDDDVVDEDEEIEF